MKSHFSLHQTQNKRWQPARTRLHLELLEERLPPGETVLGALLAGSLWEPYSKLPALKRTASGITLTDPLLGTSETIPITQTLSPEGREKVVKNLSSERETPAGISSGGNSGILEPEDIATWADGDLHRRPAALFAGKTSEVFKDFGRFGFETSSGFSAERNFQQLLWVPSVLNRNAQEIPSELSQNLIINLDGPPAQIQGSVQALFNLESPQSGPFPSNWFTVRDRNNNTNLRVNMPLPDCSVRVSDCEDLNVINTLDGFNLQPRLSIPFSGPIDVNSVTSNTVFLVSLGDTLNRHDRGGQVVGINQVVWDVASNSLHVESDQLLDQHTRYALIVTGGVQDQSGHPVEATEEFRHFRQTVHGAYKDELLDAVHAARRLGVREGDIVTASVFTTESATAVLEKIRDQIHAATPAPADFNLGPDGTRTVFPLDEVTGITFNEQTLVDGPLQPVPVNLPLLRIVPGAVGQVAFGKYVSPEYEVHPGEFIPPVATRTGTPVVQGTNDIYFNLFLPSGPKPPGGWPVAIHGIGSAGSKQRDLFVVASMAEQGIATLIINTVGRGFGPLGTLTVDQAGGPSVTLPAGGRGIDQNGDGIIEAAEGANATAPNAIIGNRDSNRQTVVDFMQLVRVIERGMDVDGDADADLDSSRISYLGWSQGANLGTTFLAVEPDVCAGALYSLGGPDNRLSPVGRSSGLGTSLAAQMPSLINSPGINMLAGVALPSGPFFNENVPLRDGIPLTVGLTDGTTYTIQSPVINTVAGANAIQEYLDKKYWVNQSGNQVAYAAHLRRDPLPGVPAKSVLILFAKGDEQVPNPSATALLRAGDLADRATFYRNDLAFAEDPAVPKNPHPFVNNIDASDPLVAAIARGAQNQIAVFLASDGTVINHPEPSRFFETPIQRPLPEDLNFIP